MKETDLLSFNGVNGATGDYLTPEMTAAEVSKIARSETFDKNHLLELKNRHYNPPTHGVKEGVDPIDLAQSGWGIVFAYNDNDKITAWKEALTPLLDLRREQAGDLYREYIVFTDFLIQCCIFILSI